MIVRGPSCLLICQNRLERQLETSFNAAEMLFLRKAERFEQQSSGYIILPVILARMDILCGTRQVFEIGPV